MATVHLVDRRFEAASGVAVLDAATAAGVLLEHSCRTGRCGSCKTRVTHGETRPLIAEPGLTRAERDAGYILTCARAATSDALHLDTESLPGADLPVRTLPCRIDTLDRLAPDVLRVVLRLPPATPLAFRAGQSVDVIGRDGLRRSYSLAAAPGEGGRAGRLELHIRRVDGGAFSRYWFDAARAGDLLRLEGPRGSFFLRDVAGLDLVLLATGTGIAPIKALLEDLATRPAAAQPRMVSLWWGGRTPVDLYWAPEHAGLVPSATRLQYHPVLSRADADWRGARGHVQQALLRTRPDLSRAVVYACGSAAMTTSARAELVAAGLLPRRFFADAFLDSGPSAV